MEKICDVVGCDKVRFKTVPSDLAKKVFTLKTDKTKVHLCKDHYKEYKRKTKEERDLDRADWV